MLRRVVVPALAALGVAIGLGRGAHAQDSRDTSPASPASAPAASTAADQEKADGSAAVPQTSVPDTAPIPEPPPSPSAAVEQGPPPPAYSPASAEVPPLAIGAALPTEPQDQPERDGLARHPFIGQAYLTGGFVYGSSSNPNLRFDLAGMGFEVGASFLLGPHFPGLHGGLWNGVLLQPGLSVYAASELPRPMVASNIDGVVMLSGGILLGYQFDCGRDSPRP